MSWLKDYCDKYIEYRDGDLYWKARPSPRVVVGTKIGRLRCDGYMDAKINGKKYLLHRIVWVIFNGDLPTHTIDHIDRNRSNNKIENLRDVTLSINLRNSGKGYYWCKRERKFIVYRWVDNKRKYFGRFESEDSAKQACEG